MAGSLWAKEPAFLIFLRHFGCIACSEHIADLLPRLEEIHRRGIAVALIGCGEGRYLNGFIERHQLRERPITVLTDPTLEAHRMLSLRRGLWSTFGPRAAFNVLRAFFNKHSQSTVEGDPLQQGATFLIDTDGSLHFSHIDRSVGDYARTSDLIDAAVSLRGK